MNITARSMIAATAAVFLSAALSFTASAAIKSDHTAWSDTPLKKTGFLGYKSFLIGPSALDNPGVALESMRIISPATIFANTRGYRQKLLPPELFMPLEPLPALESHDMDALKINVKGAPTTFSLGLKSALQDDLTNHTQLFGVSGLTSPVTGFASAAYLQSATQDVLKKIDQLEQWDFERATHGAAFAPSPKTYALQEPPTILLFLTGLLFIVLLCGDRLQTKPAA